MRKPFFMLSFMGVASAYGMIGRVSAATEYTFTPAALSGQPMPGVVGSSFGAFSTNTELFLNGGGQVLFPAVASVGGKESIWLGKPGAIQAAAVEGRPAPETGVNFGAGMFISYVPGQLNDAGQCLFFSKISNGEAGLWAGAPGSLKLVARTGTHAPGAPAAFNFDDLYPGQINSQGDVIIVNGPIDSTGGPANRGIWAGTPGNIQLVALQGQPAPGAAGSKYYLFHAPHLNDSGKIAYQSILSLDTNPLDEGIWVGNISSPQLAVRAGSPFPDGAVGEKYDTLYTMYFNNQNRIAFPATSNQNTRGIVIGESNSLHIVGEDLQALTDSMALNDAGMLAFFRRLDAGGAYRLYAGTPDDIKLILAEGNHAPGTLANVIFSNFPNDRPKLNELGQVSSTLQLTGPGVVASNDRGIWATDLAGELGLVVREGQVINLVGDSARTVKDLGVRWDLNDAGQTAFVATFTDGSSGVIVATPVPEPASGLLVFAGMLLARRLRFSARP